MYLLCRGIVQEFGQLESLFTQLVLLNGSLRAASYALAPLIRLEVVFDLRQFC